MIYGIGTDIVAVERFQRFLDQGNSAILERLFTPAEVTDCLARKDAASGLSARFAGKEALLKALGTGLRNGISWQDMELYNNELGKPLFRLSGAVAGMIESEKLNQPQVSLSHDGGRAVAMVILETL